MIPMKPSSTLVKPTKSEVSAEQKNAFVELVVNAVRKIARAIIDELVQSGVINVFSLQRVLAQGNRIVAAVNTTVREEIAQIVGNVDRAKLISGAVVLEIEETDGKETIAEASDTFTGGIYGLTKHEGHKAVPTKKTRVQVYEMIKNGKYAEVFGGLSNDLNSLCFSESQIIQFVKKHRKWLRDESYGTFFLYKKGGEFFVARVGLGYSAPGVGVRPLSDAYVWRAEYRHRVVVPQLALETQS
jgi:hypothetical protein